MFEINHLSQNGLEITALRNTENNTQIHILPSAGALWHGWIINSRGKETNLIDHYKDAADLSANLSDSHKSANLSPFACRIPEGKYTFEGKQYEFKNKFKDGSAIHGLLKDKSFREEKLIQNDREARIRFIYNYRHEDAGYPFDYDCEVTYILNKDNLVTLETQVTNVSDEIIPVVDGWHPYFTTGSKINDCTLRFSSKEVIEFDEKLIPTGKLLPYREFEKATKLEDIELDHSFLLNMEKPQPLCSFSDPNNHITLHLYPAKSYPVLQIYTPPHRNSLAIETLSGAPDAFNNGIGLLLLHPKEAKIFSVSFQVEF